MHVCSRDLGQIMGNIDFHVYTKHTPRHSACMSVVSCHAMHVMWVTEYIVKGRVVTLFRW